VARRQLELRPELRAFRRSTLLAADGSDERDRGSRRFGAQGLAVAARFRGVFDGVFDGGKSTRQRKSATFLKGKRRAFGVFGGGGTLGAASNRRRDAAFGGRFFAVSRKFSRNFSRKRALRNDKPSTKENNDGNCFAFVFRRGATTPKGAT